MANQDRSGDESTDHVQDGLDWISRKLAHPSFLRGLSPSRLPSQAASEETSPARSVTFPRPQQRPRESVVKSPLRNDSLFPDGVAIGAAAPSGDLDVGAVLITATNLLTTITSGTAGPPAAHPAVDSFPYREPVTPFEQVRNYRSFVSHFNTALLLPNISSHFTKRARSTSTASHHTPPLIAMAQGLSATSSGHLASAPGQQQAAFQTFDHGHQDLVLAVDFDFYGTRMVTASSDHKLKVWDKDTSADRWTITDTWRAHDAEIVDVKFNGPFTTPSLASIAEDSRLYIWAEDVLQPRNSGHRFRRVYTLNSETTIPFCNLAFKNLMSETYLATVTRDGYLAIYEPVNSDDLSGDWGRIHGEHVCPTPDRSQETAFSVAWHNESVPCWTAVEAGLDRRSMGLAVVAMDVVKIFRTDRDRKFLPVIELTGSRNIIRDIAWANGSMRGYDLIAAASKDGAVRIYEVSTPKNRSGSDSATTTATGSRDTASVPTILEPDSAGGADSTNGKSAVTPGRPPQRNNRSALSSNLARAGTSSAVATTTTDNASPPKQHFPTMPPAPGMPRHEAKLVAEIGREHGGVWRIAWSFAGDLLVTTGDDGSVRAWKKTVDGKWMEAASLDVEGG